MSFLNKITVKYLKKNKERTIATIIGLMIGVAMILTVSMLAESSKQILSDTERLTKGSAEAIFLHVNENQYKDIKKNVKFKDVAPFVLAANAEMKLKNESLEEEKKPRSYQEVNIYYIDKKAIEKVPDMYYGNFKDKNYKVKEGDIIISSNLSNNINAKNVDGEEILVKETEGKKYNEENKKAIKSLQNAKITKKIDGNSIDMMALFVVKDFEKDNIVSKFDKIGVSVTLKNKTTALKDLKNIAKEFGFIKDVKSPIDEDIYYNTYLLLPYDLSNMKEGTNRVLMVVEIFLFAVIGIATILVIYNSFTISIAERRKDYGMLISIGASKKQIKKLVKIEAFIMATCGLILGFTIGFLGISLLYFILNRLLQSIMQIQGEMQRDVLSALQLKMIINYPVIITTIVVTYIITYLGILRPARKAAKTSPIESIKGTNEVIIKKRNVRTGFLSKKILGVEGDLANKSLKRSRSRYRITIISLTVSIVLFLVVQNTLTIGNMEINNSSPDLFKNSDYLVSANISDSNHTKTSEKRYEDVKEVCEKILNDKTEEKYNNSNILNINQNIFLNFENFDINQKEKKQYLEYAKSQIDKDMGMISEDRDEKIKKAKENLEKRFQTTLISQDGKDFNEYLKKNGIDELKQGEAIIIGNFVKRTNKEYFNLNILKKNKGDITLISNFKYPGEEKTEYKETEFSKLKVKKIIYNQDLSLLQNQSYNNIIGAIIVNKDTFFDIYKDIYIKNSEIAKKYKNEINEQQRKIALSMLKEQTTDKEITKEEIEKIAAAIPNFYMPSVIINRLYTYKNLEQEEKEKIEKNLEKVAERLYQNTNKNENVRSFIYSQNVSKVFAAIRSVIAIMKILVYGFIGLIVLISISNVFNTISTNIILRQREFANLKSMGMTKKQMRKMLDFESILYGTKVIIYGIAVSYGLMFLLELAARKTAKINFTISWQSIVYVVIGVMVIIFTTMRYARSKIDNMNIIDVIKKGSM